MHRHLLLLIASTAATNATGCAQAATATVLELAVQLPAQEDLPRGTHAMVQTRDSRSSFDTTWSGEVLDPAFRLTAEPRVELVEIAPYPGAVDLGLRVRVKFCGNATCTSLGDESLGIPGDDQAPESRLEIDRPFCRESRTRVRWNIAPISASELALPPTGHVSRCEVECVAGESCCAADGTDLCDR